MQKEKLFRPFRLASRLPGLARAFARHGLPDRVLLFGSLSPGDDLLCTTVLREARKRIEPFAMMTSRPELFEGNADPAGLIPPNPHFVQALRCLGRNVVQPYYAASDSSDLDRDVFAPGHILSQMCRIAGLKGEITLRPYFFLTAKERAGGRRANRQIAFQSTAAGAAVAFRNKEWRPELLAQVANALPPGYTAVQLGLPSDPPLPRALDLRGKTTLREAAAVIAASEAFVGLEGFLAHLARAVDCPAVVVLGGRVLPETTGYAGNIYLAHPTPCTPCGLRNRCDFGRACLEQVTVAAVRRALETLLSDSCRTLPEIKVSLE